MTIEEQRQAILLGQAQRVALHRGLLPWDRLPVRQTKECGWACQETCLRLARGDLEALTDKGAGFHHELPSRYVTCIFHPLMEKE